jgi:hypothetical protein
LNGGHFYGRAVWSLKVAILPAIHSSGIVYSSVYLGYACGIYNCKFTHMVLPTALRFMIGALLLD